jgi:hypothetical protein
MHERSATLTLVVQWEHKSLVVLISFRATLVESFFCSRFFWWHLADIDYSHPSTIHVVNQVALISSRDFTSLIRIAYGWPAKVRWLWAQISGCVEAESDSAHNWSLATELIDTHDLIPARTRQLGSDG